MKEERIEIEIGPNLKSVLEKHLNYYSPNPSFLKELKDLLKEVIKEHRQKGGE